MADSEEAELRKGPWTLEEDTLLIHYISSHGEGRWNLLARCSGLKRTGKSCRLRWLNYLKPDVKRGNLTPEEQLLILELHSKWGNRWSRIAQHLPGRTDNEIKNYWRTRVQKQARQLNIDANSTKFRDAIRLFWIPRLLQQMQSTRTAPRCSSSDINYVDASINSTPAADLTTLISCQAAVPESSQPSSPTKTQISNSNSTSTTTWGDETYCSSVSSDSKKMTQYSTTTFPEIIPDQEEFPTSPRNNVSEGSSVLMYNVDDPFQRSGGTTNYSYADTCNYDLESLINNMQGYYDVEYCGATDCSIAERCSSWDVHGTTENYLWDMDELRPIIGTSTTSTMS